MWGIIASIIGALVGFGTSIIGINQLLPSPQFPDPAIITTTSSCYNPEPDTKLTLNWPDDFGRLPNKLLTDNRVTLNPVKFGSLPSKYSSHDNCREMLLTDTNGVQKESRNYIRVRENARISSCKTDEGAGPYNGENGKSCFDITSPAAQQDRRGNCTVNEYDDLRKVAEIQSYGEMKEIFWVPVSHNAGCNYDPKNPNCSQGSKANLNLREFIYVLKKRDAYDKNDPSKCTVKWDAGSVDKNACSHYFDIYMAEDLYNKVQNVVPETDPDYSTYNFYKQAIENCTEQNTLIPVTEDNSIRFPPYFISKPFLTRITEIEYQLGKIIPSNDLFILENYRRFILSNFNPTVNSLLQIGQSTDTIDVCLTPPGKISTPFVTLTSPTPTVISGPNCYNKLGSITLIGKDNQPQIFSTYSRSDTPQTFYLKAESGPDNAVYQYTITQMELPINDKHAPALQLAKLDFTTENEWFWGTPQCKPALYFYPEKITDMNVKLKLDGRLTKSDPVYNEETGWDIRAFPNGKLEIRNKKSVQEIQISNLQYPISYFPYLYYEANIKGIDIPKEGWVVSKSVIGYQLSEIMFKLGFNEKETHDFLEYWLPRLSEKPYYFITLLPEDIINSKETLIFSEKPETLIRARFVFEGLDLPVFVKPINLPNKERNGFTVTDWGGTIVGKSCQDMVIK
jgi:hypothetical protein